MTSAIPVNHHPRHPHAFSPTVNPHYTPRSSSSSYYPSSSISTQQSSSYWSTAGSSSVSTVASSSPRVNPGLAAAQFVSKHTTGRFHKRSKSGTKTPDEVEEDSMLDEGFFSGPGSPPPSDPLFKVPKAKAKIKPLLKKVAVTSRNNSLDLSRSDGGIPGGVGLGIYDSNYDSSGVDEEMLETAFPKHVRRRHARNISGTSGGSVGSPLIAAGTIAIPVQPFAHPNRQLPRRGVYTPDLSRDVSSESSDSDDEERETRRIVLSGSHRGGMGGLTLDTSHSGRSTPMLPNTTPSMTDLHSTRGRATGSQLTSPVSPVSPADLPSDSISFVPAIPIPIPGSHKKSKARGRISSTHKKSSAREPSPSFAASVTAARLAWEAKEEKKEEKREKKRRRSEAKEEERRNSTSRCSHRGRGYSGSTGQSSSTAWNADELNEKAQGDWSDGDEVYGAPPTRRGTTTRGTGRKWGVQNPQPHPSAPPPPAHQQPGGLKKRWLGFIVWVRIGMVRLGRKMGF